MKWSFIELDLPDQSSVAAIIHVIVSLSWKIAKNAVCCLGLYDYIWKWCAVRAADRDSEADVRKC